MRLNISWSNTSIVLIIYIPFNINLSLSWISLLGILGNLVTISLLYKSLCAGRLFINKQFTGVHLWGVLSVELPPSTDPRGRPIAKGDTLCVCVLNEHRDVTTVSVVPCPFLLIMVVWFLGRAWLSFFGSTLGGLSGWTPALYISLFIF